MGIIDRINEARTAMRTTGRAASAAWELVGDQTSEPVRAAAVAANIVHLAAIEEWKLANTLNEYKEGFSA